MDHIVISYQEYKSSQKELPEKLKNYWGKIVSHQKDLPQELLFKQPQFRYQIIFDKNAMKKNYIPMCFKTGRKELDRILDKYTIFIELN